MEVLCPAKDCVYFYALEGCVTGAPLPPRSVSVLFTVINTPYPSRFALFMAKVVY